MAKSLWPTFMILKIIIKTVGVASTLALAGCATAPAPATDSTAAAEGGATPYPLSIENCDAEVTVEQVPKRAVSLNQSATEIMIRLGLAARMAGTSYETVPVPSDIADTHEGIPLFADHTLVNLTPHRVVLMSDQGNTVTLGRCEQPARVTTARVRISPPGHPWTMVHERPLGSIDLPERTASWLVVARVVAARKPRGTSARPDRPPGRLRCRCESRRW